MLHLPFAAFFAVAAAAASTITTATGPALTMRLARVVAGVYQTRPDTTRAPHPKKSIAFKSAEPILQTKGSLL